MKKPKLVKQIVEILKEYSKAAPLTANVVNQMSLDNLRRLLSFLQSKEVGSPTGHDRPACSSPNGKRKLGSTKGTFDYKKAMSKFIGEHIFPARQATTVSASLLEAVANFIEAHRDSQEVE